MQKTKEEAPQKAFDFPKKTYRPLALWLTLGVAVMLLLSVSAQRVAGLAGPALTRVTMGMPLLFVEGLMVLIHRGGYAYWVNGGPSYEAAAQAGWDACRRYTRAHLRVFTKAFAAGVACLALGAWLRLPVGLDIAAVALSLIVGALCTLKIRFAEPASDGKTGKAADRDLL